MDNSPQVKNLLTFVGRSQRFQPEMVIMRKKENQIYIWINGPDKTRGYFCIWAMAVDEIEFNE